MSQIASLRPHLERRFADHQVVFWHDPDFQYSDELDGLELGDVTILRVANNEYAIKNQLLQDTSGGRFLVYRPGPVPAGIGNWLLDLELAYGIFRADRGELVSQELGLTAPGIDAVIAAHGKFFNAAKRVQALHARLEPEDDATKVRAKMCAIVIGQKEHSFLELSRTLLIENAEGRSTCYDSIVDYGLEDFYWRGAAHIYGYQSDAPSIDDFVLWMFRMAAADFEVGQRDRSHKLQLDFASFRNDRRSYEALATLARRASVDLGYKATIEDASFQDFGSFDLFEEAEHKIIASLASAIADQATSLREVSAVVRARQNSFWIDGYKQLYLALDAAAELLAILDANQLSTVSFDEALDRYCADWFRVDQLYRRFTYACRTFDGPHPLEALRSQIENRYISGFVYELGNQWQKHVDAVDSWSSSTLRPQQAFFDDHVARLLRDDKKAVVIVSDALRYEAAEELGARIRQEDRFDARLEAVLGVLPSYTQLGMAALLPHGVLEHSPDGEIVLADGKPTSGTVARSNILATVGGSALQAEDFKALSPEGRRELFRDNRVLYLFHNRIDATGDKLQTERQVFEAVEDAHRDLVDLVKKCASANFTNIFITADHGFLFQDSELPPQFFLSEKPQGDDLQVVNRRYVLGRGLKASQAFTSFRASQLGFDGEIEVQIPKSIHRLKLAGGGARFVHGGATLQEVVVPVLVINKKRRSDTRMVNVQVLPDTDKITTGQLVVKLFQSEPVSDKVHARTLRVGLYVGDVLISNDPQPELRFDAESEEQRDRYQSIQLLLGQDSDAYNNRVVELRLEERIRDTNQWRLYEKASYTLKRSFSSDFDF